jgi:hypothetical protein
MTTESNVGARILMVDDVKGNPRVLTQRICEYIESHLDQKIGLEALAAMAGSPLIISQGHSTNRWECRLTATF